MSFTSRELSVLAYANGFTLWHYRTSDTASEITAPGYFVGAADMVRDGDLILANHALSNGQLGAALLRMGVTGQGALKAVALTGGKSG